MVVKDALAHHERAAHKRGKPLSIVMNARGKLVGVFTMAIFARACHGCRIAFAPAKSVLTTNQIAIRDTPRRSRVEALKIFNERNIDAWIVVECQARGRWVRGFAGFAEVEDCVEVGDEKAHCGQLRRASLLQTAQRPHQHDCR